MRNFRKLNIWNDSMVMVELVYHQLKLFPKDEGLVLSNQMRRSALSIPSNIAEGSNRSERQFKHYLNISLGSSYELETQLIIALRMGCLSETNYEEIMNHLNILQRMINSLISKL